MSSDGGQRRLDPFYCPKTGRCGDFIPFYWDGEYHLFHIQGEPWYHVSTKDLVSFTEHGVAIPSGGPDSQDRDIYTGCVTEKDGLFYIFYTGHNPDLAKQGKFGQVVMLANSKDLITWTKDPDFRLEPDTSLYSGGAWRDPHVFWNDAEGEYWMILCSATKDRFSKRWGCTPLYTSPDLMNWTSKGPIYAPGLYDSHECPDMFRIGDWWYLIFSTYSRNWETRYRMAKTPSGPWIVPQPDDLFEGRTFYAAKTLSDGKRRLLVGWTAVKEGEKDEGKYLWGGNLLIHELVQRSDGTLGVKLPDEIRSAFSRPMPLAVEPGSTNDDASGCSIGQWIVNGTRLSCDSPGRFSSVRLADMPDACMIRASATFAPGTSSLGFMLRMDSDNLENWYQVRLEPGRNRVVFDRSTRYFVDQSFIEERPVRLEPGVPVQLEVVVSGSIISIHVDNQIALTARGYDLTTGSAGLFVEEGDVKFDNVFISII